VHVVAIIGAHHREVRESPPMHDRSNIHGQIIEATDAGSQQFTYRGVNASRSTNAAGQVSWTAEIRRERHYQFLSAPSAWKLIEAIDNALDRWTPEEQP
jgi:hypothetical protein